VAVVTESPYHWAPGLFQDSRVLDSPVLSRVLQRLGPETIVIDSDNQGAIALSKNPGNHGRSKHIDIQHHFVREVVEAGKIKVTFMPTDKMVADGLTKPLSKEKFRRFRDDLGLLACPLDNGL
jgi:hypothetical protein